MIKVSLHFLSELLNAELIGDSIEITEVTIDTRKVTAGCLFVALKGERFDGHDFAEDAVAAGAAALLVSKRLLVGRPQLVVKDTRLALGQFAAWVRQQVPARVVALTGSSGKTSVKEMTAAILRQCGNVLYTAGNFNNDIGVPLTLLRLTPEYDFAVIELGANHVGEIAYTTDLSRPESALVNNLAAAHLEGFGSLAGVAQAKGEILPDYPLTAPRLSMLTAMTGHIGKKHCITSRFGVFPLRVQPILISMPVMSALRRRQRISPCIHPLERLPLSCHYRGGITSPMRLPQRR